MHRINRDMLRVELSVCLKTALARHKELLRAKRLPHETDALSDALAVAILDLVDCDSRAVVQTETYGYSAHGPRQGKWGIDEPAP
ncbi:MAG: hypothetical protein IT552_09750 [Sphingomonadaceae bacterium]|nr:hypothetical protein [Sphingomonadaceae bacterium]